MSACFSRCWRHCCWMKKIASLSLVILMSCTVYLLIDQFAAKCNSFFCLKTLTVVKRHQVSEQTASGLDCFFRQFRTLTYYYRLLCQSPPFPLHYYFPPALVSSLQSMLFRRQLIFEVVRLHVWSIYLFSFSVVLWVFSQHFCLYSQRDGHNVPYDVLPAYYQFINFAGGQRGWFLVKMRSMRLYVR